MALSVIDKPAGFRPVGAGSLIYKFNEGSIGGKVNYRVEIQLNGLTSLLPVFSYSPDSNNDIYCDIAPLLRAALAMTPTIGSTPGATRFNNTYVKYQAKWDASSDAQVDLNSDVIYYYTGQNTPLFPRTKFFIDNVGGPFLIPTDKLHVWAARTAYVDFLNDSNLDNPTRVLFEGVSGAKPSIGTFNGSVKGMQSFPYQFTEDGTIRLIGEGSAWALGTSANDYTWTDVAWNGVDLFVAVSSSGTGNRVMTSPDGFTWTPRTSAADSGWRSVAYGNGLWVAVAATGSSNQRIMTSTDGISWTLRNSPATLGLYNVIYANGLWVAVGGDTGNTSNVLTSSNGTSWTTRTSASSNRWEGLEYGNGVYVAVTAAGTTSDSVMTSPDGIAWTIQSSPISPDFRSVAYGNGLFVAAGSGASATDMLMTSPDGVTWTMRTSSINLPLIDIVWSGTMFVAIGFSTDDNCIISYDGINWFTKAIPSNNNSWDGIAFGAGVFVAVGQAGTGNRVMTLAQEAYYPSQISVELEPECSNPIYLKWLNDVGGLTCWLFDYNQTLSIDPLEFFRHKKLRLYSRPNLASDSWYMLSDLVRNGPEYGGNVRAGQYLIDFTVEGSPVNVVTIPTLISRDTKMVGNRVQLNIRYPQIDNIGI